MGKVILFSNVSNSEPIHPYNYYDGAMFHICRNIHPDVVYLYCSKEILDKKINVKCKECIKLLDEKIEIKEFEKKYLKDADDFDFYYKDFEKCINDIKKEQNIKEDDILYLNLTSGTSAMISALITLKVLAFNEAKFINLGYEFIHPMSAFTVEFNNDIKATKMTICFELSYGGALNEISILGY